MGSRSSSWQPGARAWPCRSPSCPRRCRGRCPTPGGWQPRSWASRFGPSRSSTRTQRSSSWIERASSLRTWPGRAGQPVCGARTSWAVGSTPTGSKTAFPSTASPFTRMVHWPSPAIRSKRWPPASEGRWGTARRLPSPWPVWQGSRSWAPTSTRCSSMWVCSESRQLSSCAISLATRALATT